MRCRGLGKGFFPAIKTWKSFTTKLLQKLHPCKIIQIKETRRAKAINKSRAPPSMYYLSLPTKKNLRRRSKERNQLFGNSKAALHRPKQQHHFNKQSLQAPPPVFIDGLFWAHSREVEEGLPGCSALGGPKSKAEPVTSSALMGPHNASSASHQLRGIDARAEAFITRFRAELNQEIVA